VGVLSRPGASHPSAEKRSGACMSQYIFKMPDLGEGTVDAEIVAWYAKPGDQVTEDQLIVEVMTDKAPRHLSRPRLGRPQQSLAKAAS
jgi:2-oxoisovalerate dehydrogenase E2 component (dihydrolipoyl transacylase)